MISDRLLSLVRCPECRVQLDEVSGPSAQRPAGARAFSCRNCGRTYNGEGGYLDLRPRVEYSEQTKYLDESLHADARHERVSPPLLGSKIRNDMLRTSSTTAHRSRGRSGLRERPALLWNRDWMR